MGIFDILLLGALVISFLIGFRDGFIRKFIGTAVFFIGIFCGLSFYEQAGKIINKMFGIEAFFAKLCGGFLVFVICILIGAVLKRVIHPFKKLNNLFNKIVGGLAGLAQMVFILSALLYLLSFFNLPSEETKTKSLLYSRVSPILPATLERLEKYTPAARESFEHYIEHQDTLEWKKNK